MHDNKDPWRATHEWLSSLRWCTYESSHSSHQWYVVSPYIQGLAIRTVGKDVPRLQHDFFSAVISVRYSRGLTAVDWLCYLMAHTPDDNIGPCTYACFNPAHLSQSSSQAILISVTSDYPRLPQTSPVLKRGAGDGQQDYRVGMIPIPIPIPETLRDSRPANMHVFRDYYIHVDPPA